ncbi:MAG: sigma-70 family RNA polymerase sigma factor [bacterium]
MEATSSAELLARARKGDVDAFLVLFEESRQTIHSVAWRLVGPDEAEDVVMETYLRAWKSIPGFTGRSAVRTWLCRIAHNCSVDWLRKRRHVVQPLESRGDDDGEGERGDLERFADPRQRKPSEIVAGIELQASLDEALEQVSPEHREVLLLRFSDGLSYSEIAAATGVSMGTVMSRLFNGRRKLMKALKELGVGARGGES